MLVVTLTDCPPALRGDLSKWLQEIDTGVFVGRVSSRVRDDIWKRIEQNAKSGRATMVFSAANEQRMDFRVHGSSWLPIDFDGLKLIMRPSSPRQTEGAALKTGFSKAAAMQKAKNMSRKRNAPQPLLSDYLVLDLETTGLSPTACEIIEIGALKIHENEVCDTFHALIKPQNDIPPSVANLTGLSHDLLTAQGKELAETLSAFLGFAGDLPVVSHNADFDYAFMHSACRKCNLPLFSNQCVDTLPLARRLIDDADNHKLATLAKHFNIETTGAHRSLCDCKTTKLLYEKLIEILHSGV